MNFNAFDRFDALAVLGLWALEYGIAQWSHPAAWVVGGLLLIAAASRGPR